MEGLLSGASLDRQVSMLESFVREWNGTSAANEAAKTLGQRKQEQERIAAEEARKRGQFQGWIEKARTAISGRQWQTAESALKEAESLFPSDPAVKQTRSEYEKANPFRDFAVDLGGAVKLEMVYLEGGSFQMGSPDSEEGRDSDEGPVHTVELDGFWIGKYEVTQEQYEAIMRTNPSNFKGTRNPVECVSWNDATEFCKKLNDIVVQASLPAFRGKTFRLPTEAEWAYACRAGSRTRFCFGDSDNALGEYAWYTSNSEGRTHPVGEKKPNAWGLYDIHGNVWEWCGDWYGENYYAGSPRKNPTGPSSGQVRVLRGGSGSDIAQSCRSANRYGYGPTDRIYLNGFRVVSFSGGL